MQEAHNVSPADPTALYHTVYAVRINETVNTFVIKKKSHCQNDEVMQQSALCEVRLANKGR